MRLFAILSVVFTLAGTSSAESLSFKISLSAGLPLGEATMHARETGDAATPWAFTAEADLSLPGFTLRDQYHAAANAKFCSAMLDKIATRGERKTTEHVTFDQIKLMVTRKTEGGGSSEYSVSDCARDPLTLLQFVRKELAQGRLASRQAVIFGSRYDIRFDYAGVQKIKVGGKDIDAECLHTSVKGPASENAFDLYFARDAVRTPVLAKIPLGAGTFLVELTR